MEVVNEGYLINPMPLIEEESEDKKTMIFEDEDRNLLLRSSEGTERTLPKDLYEELSDISDAYDPTKEFIGYVDPVHGVVLVDASSLEEAFEQQKHEIVEVKSLDSVSTRSTDVEKYFITSNPNSNTENEHETAETSAAATTSHTDNANFPPESPVIQKAPPPPFPSKHLKTMHQLAYEKKTGRYLPNDDTRPISGFGIKHGELLINSTTFNAFNDEFHTEERTMGLLEEERLTALVEKLNKEFQMNKKTKLCSVM